MKKERGKFLPKVAEKKQATRKERLAVSRGRFFFSGIIFLWLLFFGTVVYLIIFSPYLKVTALHIEGLALVDEGRLRSVVNEELARDYLRFIPRDTFFLVPTESLERLLAERYPLLRSVTVRRTFPGTLAIRGEERTTIVLWCSAGTCAHVLENGTVIPTTEAYQEEKNQERTIVLKDESGQPLRFGEGIFEDDFVPLVVFFREQLQARFGIETENSILLASRFANELRIRTREGWGVYFNTGISRETSLDTLGLLLDGEIPRERLAVLRYIDLRTENRAFYRYQDGESEVQEIVVPPKEVKIEKKKKQ